jgi:prepilin peptidase CpaA
MLLLAGAVLFIIYDDFRHYRIRNSITGLLGLLFLAWTIARGDYSNLLWHAVFACGASTLLLVLYARDLMGGGDVKLLAVAFLWVGWQGSLIFSVVLFVASFVYAVGAKLELFPSIMRRSKQHVPFGPSIGLALLATQLFFWTRGFPMDSAW